MPAHRMTMRKTREILALRWGKKRQTASVLWRRLPPVVRLSGGAHHGWSKAPECDLGSHKACDVDDDSALVQHRLNCCGST